MSAGLLNGYIHRVRGVRATDEARLVLRLWLLYCLLSGFLLGLSLA